MKIVAILLSFVLASFGYFGPPDPPAPSGVIEDEFYQKSDMRVYKSHLTGKFVDVENPAAYFEIFDDYGILSKALYAPVNFVGGGTHKEMGLYYDCGITWVSFLFCEKEWISSLDFYYGGGVELDTFILKSGNRIFKKVIDEAEQPVETFLDFLPGDFSFEDGGDFTARSSNIFQRMPSRVYKLEIEKITGEELRVYRGEDGECYGAFEHEGYYFDYKLSDGSYDLLPGATVKVANPNVLDGKNVNEFFSMTLGEVVDTLGPNHSEPRYFEGATILSYFHSCVLGYNDMSERGPQIEPEAAITSIRIGQELDVYKGISVGKTLNEINSNPELKRQIQEGSNWRYGVDEYIENYVSGVYEYDDKLIEIWISFNGALICSEIFIKLVDRDPYWLGDVDEYLL